jgi:anti-sigma regulatory factor (Ser/Thr protein kinase)
VVSIQATAKAGLGMAGIERDADSLDVHRDAGGHSAFG